mgnify:CR=1 FL=1
MLEKAVDSLSKDLVNFIEELWVKSLQMMWHYNIDNLDAKTEILIAYIQQSGKRGKNITKTLVKDVVASYNKDGTRKKYDDPSTDEPDYQSTLHSKYH